MPLFPESVFNELFATRYMGAVGLMVLLYDHLLTFADEVDLIWTAPATYAKYIFLLNRYTVLGTLLAVAYESCGFVATTFSNAFVFAVSMLAIVSVGIANLLVLQRVVILWEHRPIVLKIMTVGFLVSFTAQVVTMTVTLINLLPFILWSDIAGMCIATKSSPLLSAVWASPMLFEVFVLGLTALNALDRPRTVELPITKALHSDGIGFFLSITLLRVMNLTLAAVSRPSLTFLAVFFIWAMTTTVLGRLLIHLRRTECRPYTHAHRSSGYSNSHSSSASASVFSPSYDYDDDYDDDDDDEYDEYEYDRRRRSRAISPFGLVPIAQRPSSRASDRSNGGRHGRALSVDNQLEIAQIPAAYAHPYHYRKRTYDPHLQPWD